MFEPVPPPASPGGWTPHDIAVWIVGIITFLTGGGAITNIFLRRLDRKDKEAKEDIEREDRLHDRAAAIIADQDAKLHAADEKITLLYKDRLDGQRALIKAEVDAAEANRHMSWWKAQADDIKIKFDQINLEVEELRRLIHTCERDKVSIMSELMMTKDTVQIQNREIHGLRLAVRELQEKLSRFSD